MPAMLDNPLLQPWLTPFETPPFDQIKPEHFIPAFEQAFGDHVARSKRLPPIPPHRISITPSPRWSAAAGC